MTATLTSEELRGFERRLRDELAKLAIDVEQVEEEALGPSGERLQESDESLEEAALDSDLAVIEAQGELVFEVREALDRIAAGTFGVCESCNQPISRARLELLPYARLCETCARREEAAAKG